MKHNIKYILSVCIGIALTMGLSAQTLNSSYFMEKMTKRNQLNPALKTPNGYVSFPALGNFYLGVNSNLGLGTFLYPRGNELVTFLHPSVPADDFLGKLTPNNTVELDLGLDIISFGFWAWGGQNTFNLALKSYSGAYMPKEIFQFLKTGQKETGITRYDMSNITVSTDNYVELALGHARDINDKLGVGAKVKVLVGAAHAEARIDRMDISMSQDEWFIKQAGHIQASSLLKLETDPETGEGNNPFDDKADELGDDLEALAKFYKSDSQSVTNSLRTTMRIGAEYSILDNHISFGLLSTTRFGGHRTYAEGMAAVNFRPLSALHITLNGSVSNMGSSVGAILNVCAPGFNLFFGTDYFATKYSKQFIPINHARANFCFGINFTFGKKHEI